jgi:hypothetical protein
MKFYKNVQVPVRFNLQLQQSFTGNDETYLEFLASDQSVSLSGHRMELPALQKMRNESIGLPSFLNHDPNRIVGNITSVKESSPDKFMPRVTLLKEVGDSRIDEPVKTLKNWLANSVQVGASIGASILEMAIEKENNKPIVSVSVRDLKLIEVSLTAVPAVTSTRGTVKTCKNGFCQSIGNQILNQVYLNNNFTIGDDKMEIKQLAEEIKYKKYNPIEKRQVVKNLNQELQKIEDQMNGKLNTWKMDEYGSLEEDKNVLVSVLQGLDPTYSVRKSLGF